jgi:hypothetical protein
MRTYASTVAKSFAIAIVALIGSASAQQTSLQSYDVELIIFRTLSTKVTPEDWRMESGTANGPVATTDEEVPDGADAEAVIAPPPTAPTMTFPTLPQTKFKLTAIADTLRRSRSYQPLAHFGWTQPGFPRGEARYMSIDGLVPASTGISGQIALARGRYLHLTLELAYDSPEESGQRMVLRQTRRMRSNERHYIDHPKFGVIAVITPATP